MVSRKCEYCPMYADQFGIEVGILGLLTERGLKRRIPNVWVATSSSIKVATLVRSLEVIEASGGDIDWGKVMPMPMEIVRIAGAESNYLDGAKIAEEKAREYWRNFVNTRRIDMCHRYNNCDEDHVVLANDVNSWIGIAGNGPEIEMRKPSGKEINTKIALVDDIVSRYRELEEKHNLTKNGGLIVHRVEAAMAMLKPSDKKDWSKVDVVSGVSQAYIHIPIGYMLDRDFVAAYVDRAKQRSGSLEMVLGAAGGIMHEYLVEMIDEWGGEVQLDMPSDSRVSKQDLLLAHARGFVPRLIEGLWGKMESGSTNGNGTNCLIMAPGR